MIGTIKPHTLQGVAKLTGTLLSREPTCSELHAVAMDLHVSFKEVSIHGMPHHSDQWGCKQGD